MWNSAGVKTAGMVVSLFWICNAYVVTGVSQRGDTVRFAIDNGRVLDVVPAFNQGVECCVYDAAAGRGPKTPSMNPAYRPQSTFSVGSLTSDPVVITGPSYVLEVRRSDFFFTFKAPDGSVLYRVNGGDGIWDGTGEAKIQGSAVAGRYYGIQNKTNQLNQWFGIGPIQKGDQGHAGGAFAWTPNGFGVFFDSPGGFMNVWDGAPLHRLDFGRSGADKTRLFYFMSGTPLEINRMYHELTGFPQMPPLWSLGFIHSEWGQNQSEALQTVRTFRDSGIGLDGFTFDFEWMAWGQDNYGEFRWNNANFPLASSGALQDTMESYGLTMIGIRKPRIHVNTVQGLHCETNGFFDPNAYVNDYMTGQRCGQIDFSKPAARRWWWESFVDPSYNSYERGIRAYWNDEPGYGDNFLNLHWQQANYDGHRSYDTTRVFSLNRCYFAGSQKYAYGLWSGDIGTGFAEMAKQRYAMLTSVVLGASWWSMDIGGFLGTPSAENYFRWMQMGAFVPFYRYHCHNSVEREPWHFGSEAMRISRDFINLRYQLLDYLYSAFYRLSTEAIPPVRPLVMDYPQVAELETEAGAWMFGDAMLVAPIVTAGATSASFYLPSGRWYDFWDNSKHDGGRNFTRTTGRDRIPVMVKSGAIIPLRSAARYALDSAGLRSVDLHVYAGDSSTFTWYEDDYVSYKYEQGAQCRIPISHQASAVTEIVTVGAAQGSFAPRQRSGQIVLHGVSFTPAHVAYNWQNVPQTTWSAFDAASAPAWAFDAPSSTVKVKLASILAQSTVIVARDAVDVLPRTTAIAPSSVLLRNGTLRLMTAGKDIRVRAFAPSGRSIVPGREGVVVGKGHADGVYAWEIQAQSGEAIRGIAFVSGGQVVSYRVR